MVERYDSERGLYQGRFRSEYAKGVDTADAIEKSMNNNASIYMAQNEVRVFIFMQR